MIQKWMPKAVQARQDGVVGLDQKLWPEGKEDAITVTQAAVITPPQPAPISATAATLSTTSHGISSTASGTSPDIHATQSAATHIFKTTRDQQRRTTQQWQGCSSGPRGLRPLSGLSGWGCGQGGHITRQCPNS